MTKRTLYTQTEGGLLTSDAASNYVLKFRDLPTEQKPREKMISHGPEVLGSAELLAVVLNVGTKKEDVMAMASRTLREYGEKIIANEQNVKRLMAELDIPETKACQIVACFELGRRFFKEETSRMFTLRTPHEVHAYLRSMADLPKEHLRGLYLNSRYQLIHDEVISIGTVTTNIVHPREVFRPALEYNASAVILAHNHPSGSVEPSTEDLTITEQLQAASQLIGIELLDHVIVSGDAYQSIITQP